MIILDLPFAFHYAGFQVYGRAYLILTKKVISVILVMPIKSLTDPSNQLKQRIMHFTLFLHVYRLHGYCERESIKHWAEFWCSQEIKLAHIRCLSFFIYQILYYSYKFYITVLYYNFVYQVRVGPCLSNLTVAFDSAQFGSIFMKRLTEPR